MLFGTLFACPVGTFERGPGLESWEDRWHQALSPVEAIEPCVRPSLRDRLDTGYRRGPGLTSWAGLGGPFGTYCPCLLAGN